MKTIHSVYSATPIENGHDIHFSFSSDGENPWDFRLSFSQPSGNSYTKISNIRITVPFESSHVFSEIPDFFEGLSKIDMNNVKKESEEQEISEYWEFDIAIHDLFDRNKYCLKYKNFPSFY